MFSINSYNDYSKRACYKRNNDKVGSSDKIYGDNDMKRKDNVNDIYGIDNNKQKNSRKVKKYIPPLHCHALKCSSALEIYTQNNLLMHKL